MNSDDSKQSHETEHNPATSREPCFHGCLELSNMSFISTVRPVETPGPSFPFLWGGRKRARIITPKNKDLLPLPNTQNPRKKKGRTVKKTRNSSQRIKKKKKQGTSKKRRKGRRGPKPLKLKGFATISREMANA